jgi:hypothetical protein
MVTSPPLSLAVISLMGKVPNEYDYPDGIEEGAIQMQDDCGDIQPCSRSIR